jgi:hypothetical protein
MENIDVIILTNTLNEYHYGLTKTTIDTLLKTDSNVNFNIIIIESNTNSKFCYGEHTVVKPNKKFNSIQILKSIVNNKSYLY